jgi:hypothetical protein
MANINKTMMEGLNQKVLQAYLNALIMPLTYQNYFPLKQNLTFSWRTLSNILQQPNVAAELQADNSTVARKRRPIIQSASGDLPLMSISREMERSEIKEYQIALALAGNDATARSLVEFWANDVNFCFNGIQSEFEYISWALISGAGKLSFSTSNNVYFANQFDLDYAVDTANKKANSVSWATAATADPIGDFQTVVKAAKLLGLNLRHIWINMDNWYLLQATAQIKALTKIYINDAASIETMASLAQVNAALQNVAYLSGITIHVVDQTITREALDGTRTSANPFADNVAVFTESTVLGSSQYSILRQNDPAVIYAQRENALIKKYGTVEPLGEITIGECDGMPVLDTAYRNMYLKTNAVAW